jgi:hypothetical protein
MGEANQGLGVSKVLHEVRDAGMDALAKLAVRVTYSHKYQRLQGIVTKPVLLGIALLHKTTRSRMSHLLALLNMPSREDVLTLSQRMTHLEMVLDDVAAGLEQGRRSAPAFRPLRMSSRDPDMGTGLSRAVLGKEA